MCQENLVNAIKNEPSERKLVGVNTNVSDKKSIIECELIDFNLNVGVKIDRKWNRE